MNEKFKREYLKFTGKKYEASFRDFIRIWSSHTMKFLYYGRLSEFAKSSILKKYYLFRSKLIGRKNRNEIPTFMNIGAGLMLCHGYGVTVNENAILGDDVMIAPNAYVNFDVPPNSVVIGNPGVIHHKDHAADDYFTAFAVRNRCGLDL